jgi:hypothetical protein
MLQEIRSQINLGRKVTDENGSPLGSKDVQIFFQYEVSYEYTQRDIASNSVTSHYTDNESIWFFSNDDDSFYWNYLGGDGTCQHPLQGFALTKVGPTRYTAQCRHGGDNVNDLGTVDVAIELRGEDLRGEAHRQDLYVFYAYKAGIDYHTKLVGHCGRSEIITKKRVEDFLQALKDR